MIERSSGNTSGGGTPTRSAFPLVGEEMNKPPAFQFYAKDWRSSPTIGRMSSAQRGVAIDLMALAWDSQEQGIIPADVKQLHKLTGIRTETLQNFLKNFPEMFHKCAENKHKLVNDKLREQASKYNEISEKRSIAAQSRYPAIAEQKHPTAFAVASASATAKEECAPRYLNTEWVKGQIEARKEANNGHRENSAERRLRLNKEAIDAAG